MILLDFLVIYDYNPLSKIQNNYFITTLKKHKIMLYLQEVILYQYHQ